MTEARRGFTLIELLLAVAILAGLAALVAPSFAGSGARRRLDDAARSIVALGGAARARATAEGRAYVLSVEGGTTRSIRLARARDPLSAPGETDAELEAEGWAEATPWAAPIALGDGVSLATTDVALPVNPSAADGQPQVRITFSPDGTAETASIELESEGGERRTIRVAGPSGRLWIAAEEAPK